MKKLDSEYWQNRYKNNLTGWDLGSISRPIKEYINQLRNKEIKILIPGAGNAHEAAYLSNNGFTNIHILDFALSPLIISQNHLKNLPEKSFIKKDFFEYEGSYDLILEQTFFCALEPRLCESYTKKMFELLNNKGALVGVLFNFKNKLIGPPFGGSKKEYQGLFKPYFNIKKMDMCYNSVEERKGKELFINLVKKK